MLLDVFHRPSRWCAAGLCFAGTGLAGWSAIVAGPRLGTGPALAFATVALACTAVGVAVLRAASWVVQRRRVGARIGYAALWTVAVVFAGQVFAVAGTAWELSTGVDAGKAGELRRLGVDPTAGVLVNLVWSALACTLAGWLAVRWVNRQR